VRAVACDRVWSKREQALEQRSMVDRPCGDAQPPLPQSVDEPCGQQHVLDAGAADAPLRRPGGERGRAVAGDRHKPGGKAQLRRELAALLVKADDLDHSSGAVGGEQPADRERRRARKLGIGMRLDVELQQNPARHQREQLPQQQRPLIAERAVPIAQPRGADLSRGHLVSPSLA
jgi:hypothetical protein